MKISGIICEYNPLHNGHLYHLEQVRRGGAEGIVAVMSGNFVQRGDAALLDKFTRARLAIEGGVDLVLELPVPYALAPAENFAMGGVALLTALGNVQEISFGSECGDAGALMERQRGGDIQRLVHTGLGSLGHAAAGIGGEGFEIASGALSVEHTQCKG